MHIFLSNKVLPMRPLCRLQDRSGFALLEVMIASAIIATVAAGTCVVLALAIHASQAARTRTIATIVAAEKMEQLRSLSWTHMTTRAPAISMSASDVTTDLSNEPATDDGRGLLQSPPGTLDANIVGYVDYLDADGRWVGHGASPPATAAYIRRWSVQPLASDPDDMLVLHVLAGTRGVRGGLSSEAVRLATIEARK